MEESQEKKVGKSAGNRGAGRKKGVPNRTTTALKDAILIAAETHGEDGGGHNGLIGYLTKVAREDVKAFSGLLGRVLPLQVDGSGLNVTVTISNADAAL